MNAFLRFLRLIAIFDLQFASDIHFILGTYRAVLSRVHSKGKGKTYFYRFDAETELNVLKKMSTVRYDGAVHADDVVSVQFIYCEAPDF